MFAPVLLASWLALHSPHFELMTDAGERAGRQTLADLESIRNTIEPLGVSPVPVRVFLFDSEEEFRHYEPSPTAQGFFQSGPDRNYIGLLSRRRRAAYHEYVHLVLNHVSGRLPKWLEEGTAEYFSTLETLGDEVVVGLPVEEHAELLRTGGLLSAEELAQVDRASPYYSEPGKAEVFYAQSWAVVHRLQAAAGRPFAFLGPPGPEALEEALQGLGSYAVRPAPARRFARARSPEPSIQSQTIQDADAVAAQAELLLLLGNIEHATRLLTHLEERLPDSPLVQHELALLALRQDHRAEAQRRLARAIGSGVAAADTYFEYAMLLRDGGEPDNRVRALLNEAVARNPGHAEAHMVLGLMLAREGRHQEAIPLFERAIEALPREESFRDALQASREAMERAGLPASPTQSKPAVYTPESWLRQADASFAGSLERVECLGQGLRLHVRAEGVERLFYVADPGQVTIGDSTATRTELSCGVQSPARALAVGYRSETGEVVALRFGGAAP